MNLPSYQVKAGDAITLSEKRSQKQLRVQEALNVSQTMDLSPAGSKSTQEVQRRVQGRSGSQPTCPADINEALIVELYSK